jgi:hypothetical protein
VSIFWLFEVCHYFGSVECIIILAVWGVSLFWLYRVCQYFGCVECVIILWSVKFGIILAVWVMDSVILGWALEALDKEGFGGLATKDHFCFLK